MKLYLFLTYFFIFIVTVPVQAKTPLHFKSSPQKVNMVELFSSEGCSSCPPAEAWLRSLRNEAGLWTQFIPLEFHVTYWDDLGWKDPFASLEYTQRQKDYVKAWKNDTLYTPGMVLNGSEWLGWRQGDLAKLKQTGQNVGVLEAKESSDQQFIVTFKPSKGLGENKFVLNAALLEKNVGSEVRRGENSGKNLIHDFLVTRFKKTALEKSHGVWQGSTGFDGADIKGSSKSYSVVFWVTANGQEAIQVVGGDLP